MTRNCMMCGAIFELAPHKGNQKYCCKKCSYAGRLKKERERMMSAYEKNRRKIPPHKLVCAKCGSTFYGHGCARYCNDCLHDGSWYMNKLLNNRSIERLNISEAYAGI